MLILSKPYKVLDEELEELCLITLKSDAKFEEKMTLASKNVMRNLVNFNESSVKSEIYTLMCEFCQKYIMFEPKNTENLCVITLKIDTKF